MSTEDPLTTIAVHSSTKKMLSMYGVGNRSYDKIIRELVEEYPPEAFLKEVARRLKEEREIPAEEVYRKLGIRCRSTSPTRSPQHENWVRFPVRFKANSRSR
jgi:hypothetical protein